MARRKVVSIDCDTTIKFEKVGQSVEGHFVGSKPIETEFGKSKIHVFKGEDGETFGIYGSAKLDEMLLSVPPGAMTFVTFNGKVSIKGGKTMKKYEVEFDDDLMDSDLTGAEIKFNKSEEPAEEETGDADDANDVDDDTINASEEDEEEAPEPKNVAKKPLVKGKPLNAASTVSASARANTTSLLNKSKR